MRSAALAITYSQTEPQPTNAAEHLQEWRDMSHITEHALQASLKRLLSIKPLNKTTINDIAEDCGINRMTSYYHFRDIYELVEWSCREDASAALSGNVTRNAWPQALPRILVSMRENKALVMNIYRGVSREHAERYLDKGAYKLVKTVFEEDADNPWATKKPGYSSLDCTPMRSRA